MAPGLDFKRMKYKDLAWRRIMIGDGYKRASRCPLGAVTRPFQLRRVRAMSKVRMMLTVTFVLWLIPAIAQADSLGLNITKFDGRDSTTTYGGQDYVGVGVGAEDNETEPGTLPYQVWDLEAMLLSGN